MSDGGLEPFQLLDFFRSHPPARGAHVLSGHDGPMRILETNVVEVRLLGAEGALELACVGGALTSSAPSRSRRGRTPNGTYLLLEAHAAAALLDGVFVKTFALLRERHELVRLRRCASRDASTQLAATTSQDDWGSHALRRTPREDCAAKYPQPQGHFYLREPLPGPGFMPIFSCPGYRRETLAVVSKINQWIGKRTKARCNGETRTINLSLCHASLCC